MATSALTAAMLNSQNADPTALMINPQMQLAQSMLQQGTDTSPIRSPWQGVARLAQVLAGRHMEGDAMKSYVGAYGNAAAAAAKTLEDAGMKGSVLYNALTSNDLQTRMSGVMAYNKTGIAQLSELHDLSPSQQTTQPGAPGPLATNSNPMSPEGQKAADMRKDATLAQMNASLEGAITGAKANAQNASDLHYKPAIAAGSAAAENPALIARAGGVAAAEAPFKTVETRSGAVLPLTAVPGIGVPAAPQQAGAGQQPPVPTGAPTQIQAAVPEPQPNAFGGGVRPLPGGKGLFAPSQDTFKPLIDEDTKEVALDRENAIKSQNDQATVTAIRDFLPKVKTGWTAPLKLQAGAILQAAGVDPKEIQNLTSIDPASGQVLQKKFVELSAAAARQMGAREPGSVIQMFAKAYPSLETTPEAINLQTNALLMNSLRQQKMAGAKTSYLNDSINGLQGAAVPGTKAGEYRGLKDFNEGFSKTDSADDYLRAAEAMSGAKWSPWSKVTGEDAQHRIISLIPQGTQYVGPDGNSYVRN